ncbi:MAG TPA: NADPH-dependent 7-cyano-7-deazaguanine reductase QueF, partial [Devosia sp.]
MSKKPSKSKNSSLDPAALQLGHAVEWPDAPEKAKL